MARGGNRGYPGKGRFGWPNKEDGSNTVLSKKQVRQEKIFTNRELRHRNTTSFFISNLPDSCNRSTLWTAFGHLENLEDVFVPFKKDRTGNKFGFLKLSNVRDPAGWIEELKQVRIEGAAIDVNIAKFDRDGSKIEAHIVGERVSVFDRLNMGPAVAKEPRGTGTGSFHNRDHRSYSSVVNAACQKQSIELPPMNSETKKRWEFKSLIGEVKDIDILNNLKEHLSGLMEVGIELRYLGGLKVLLCFSSSEEAEEFRVHRSEEWENWFSRLYVWDSIPLIFERVAWVKVLGVLVSLWDRNVFNKIGERCGRLIVKSEVEANDGNMAEERLAIIVHTRK
ncbi:putative RNA recognition motif domain, nucleotide-binding alpha-beta plait domain superfamily [Helianthus annuus]|nr:putative RNA recognition motif domain, nucleotide-binding alpha-beta plait domain superfamily [Helianthus annuus]